MNEISENSFINFEELISALSTQNIIRTKEGNLNISGNIISNKDFDKLYLSNIKDLLSKYEYCISPEFAPTKQLYSTLDIFSSPVLKNTSVPQTVSLFYTKIKTALDKTENKKTFETTLNSYVSEAEETPYFLINNMSLELSEVTNSSIYTNLMPSSDQLFDQYGTKFNGEDILDLSNNGFIDSEKPIYMLIYKSLHAQDPNSNLYLEPVSYEHLLDFYSPTKNPNRLRTLLIEGKITPSFAELHQEMLDNVSTAKRKEYISDIISESKENASTSQEFSSEILEYANEKILPDSSLEKNISGEFLKEQYLLKKITISRIFDIYKTNPTYFSAIESVLTPEEITSAHSREDLEDDSLMYVPKETRITYLQKNNTKFSTMMYLFLHCNGFSVIELKQLLSENANNENLDSYIDLGSQPEKIKELYENYLIDSQCIKNLKKYGILTDKDFKQYRFLLNKETIYQDIENTKNINLIENTSLIPFTTTGCFLGNALFNISEENVANSYKILGAPSNSTTSELPIISHLTKQKDKSILDSYRILPLRDSNLVALIPPSNTSSIYLMPYQEFAFILYNKKLPNNFIENENIKTIKQSEKLEEDILKTAYQFEESQPYLNKLRIY